MSRGVSGLLPNRVHFAKLAHGLILDCGCGKGLFKQILETRGEVVGVDACKQNLMISGYKTRVLCSATHLPFKERCFDFVWACALIEHIKEDCVQEVCTVGKKKIVFLTPNPYSPLNILNELLGLGGWFSTDTCPDHVRAYAITELKGYGKVYGDSCGVCRFYNLVPSFWKFFPWLSHTIFLVVDKQNENSFAQ